MGYDSKNKGVGYYVPYFLDNFVKIFSLYLVIVKERETC